MECGLTPDEIWFMKFAFGFVIGTVLGIIAGNLVDLVRYLWNRRLHRK